MAPRVKRGEIRLYTFLQPDKRRPVLVLTRDDAIPFLHRLVVAPITSTVRGSPGEVLVGIDEGLKGPSAVNLDHVQTVEKRRLGRYIGTMGPEEMRDVCRALAIALGCA